MRKNRWVYILVLSLLLWKPADSVFAKAKLEKVEDYLRGETDTWILKSWAPRSRTLSYFETLNDIEKCLTGIFQFNIRPKTKLQILILKDKKAYFEYAKKNFGKVLYEGGYYNPELGILFTWDYDMPQDTEKILKHEMTHYFLHQSYEHVPFWLDEGMAEYISASEVRWGKLKGGYPREDYLKIINQAARSGSLIPLGRLITQEDYLAGHDRTLQYAECWGLVYFFLHDSKKEYSARFFEYLAQLKKNPKIKVWEFFDFNRINQIWLDELMKIKVGKVKVRSEMRPVRASEE